MRSFGKALLLAASITLGALAPSAAATLTLSTSFDLASQGNGPDTPGLNGASVLVKAVFADGTIFTQCGFDLARAVASEFSFTISGASKAATNGIYAATRSIGLFATTPGLSDGYLTSGPDTFFLSPNADGTFFGIAGLVNQVRLDAGGTVGSASVGDALTLERLQNVKIGSGGVLLFARSGQGGTSYTMSNFQTTATSSDVSPVPLPAGLPLLLGGLASLAVLRRRRTVHV